jgi:hypothetical protein
LRKPAGFGLRASPDRARVAQFQLYFAVDRAV